MNVRFLKFATLFLGLVGVLFTGFSNPTSATGKVNRVLAKGSIFLSSDVKSIRASDDATNVKMAGRIDPIVTRKDTPNKKGKIQRPKRRSTNPLRMERAFDDDDDEKNALKKRSRKMKRR
jgi:hypothetical protein